MFEDGSHLPHGGKHAVDKVEQYCCLMIQLIFDVPWLL